MSGRRYCTLIRLIESAREQPAPVRARRSTHCSFLRRLWEFFLIHVASPESRRPNKLRADLISIGISLLNEADRINRGRGERVSRAKRDLANHRRWAAMTKPFSISLKSGERIFINGAVVRVDRKVSIEFLNDVTFLLEAHVMQPEQTTTPFRQLYFAAQAMLIDPGRASGCETAVRCIPWQSQRCGLKPRIARRAGRGASPGGRRTLL